MKRKTNKVVYAKDMKCIVCGKQAVAFWPCIDPDIQERPYCRECLKEAKYKMIRWIFQKDEDNGMEEYTQG